MRQSKSALIAGSTPKRPTDLPGSIAAEDQVIAINLWVFDDPLLTANPLDFDGIHLLQSSQSEVQRRRVLSHERLADNHASDMGPIGCAHGYRGTHR